MSDIGTGNISLSEVLAVVGGNSLQDAFDNSNDASFDITYKGSKDRLSNFKGYTASYNMFAGVNNSGIPVVITNNGAVSTISGSVPFNHEGRGYINNLPYFDFDPVNNIMMYRGGTGSIYVEIIHYYEQSTSRSFTNVGGQICHMVSYLNGYWVVTGESADQARYANADSSPNTWGTVAGGSFPTSGVIRKFTYGNGNYYYTTSNGEVGRLTSSITYLGTELWDSSTKDVTCINATGNKIIAMEDGQEAGYASYTNDGSWTDYAPIPNSSAIGKMVKYSSSYSLVVNTDGKLYYIYHNATTPTGTEISSPTGHVIVDVYVEPNTTNIYALTYNNNIGYIYLKTSIYDSTWELICQLDSNVFTFFKLS